MEKKAKPTFWSTKYKPIEKYFVNGDKSKDLMRYLKAKCLFRMMLATTVAGIFLGGLALLIYGRFMPGAFIIALFALIGFRYKAYNMLRGVFFLIHVVVPFTYYKSPSAMIFFGCVITTNFGVMYYTQSEILVLAHLLIHSIGIYFKGLDSITNVVKNQSPEELAENVKFAVYHTLIASLICMISLRVYNSYNFGLLRKVSALKENLATANTHLNHQNTKLQDNLEMKNLFIYTFSHELKNALNGLLGNLTLAYDAAKNSPAMNFLSSAKVCGEVLKNFIHNILDSGKLENGHLGSIM